MPPSRAGGNSEHHTPPNESASPEQQKAAKTRAEPAEALPTNRVAFDRQVKCLLAYGFGSERGTKSVSIETVANSVGMNASTVSLCNPFFVRIGLITKVGREFMPSDAVLDMARAHEFNPETATQRLAPVIARAWFARALEGKLRLGATDMSDAVQILADKANVGKDNENQLHMLIDYMRESGLVKRENNHLSWVQSASPHSGQDPGGRFEQGEEEPVHPKDGKRSPRSLALIEALVDHLPESDEAKRCSMADVADWLQAAKANLILVLKPQGQESIEIKLMKKEDPK